MALNDLKDIYIDQLQDLYSADKQSVEITRELAAKASDSDLKAALERGVEGIEQGMQMLETLIRSHDADPNGEHCKGMQGLVKEARAHALDERFGSDAARDAMIVTQYQRMVHYAIAGYGCLHAFAHRLNLDEDAKHLKQALDASYDGDRTMSDIATSGLNAEAA